MKEDFFHFNDISNELTGVGSTWNLPVLANDDGDVILRNRIKIWQRGKMNLNKMEDIEIQ